jgi:hypothetical protein
VLTSRRTAPAVSIEPIRVQIIGFEIAIDSFAARACGASSRRGLNYNEWSLVLLGYLRRRKPGLLQRGILAEQRFLQRPTHTLSLLKLKFLAPPDRPSTSAVSFRATPVTFVSSFRRNWHCGASATPRHALQSNRTVNPTPQHTDAIYRTQFGRSRPDSNWRSRP